jgi:hypothetical protein
VQNDSSVRASILQSTKSETDNVSNVQQACEQGDGSEASSSEAILLRRCGHRIGSDLQSFVNWIAHRLYANTGKDTDAKRLPLERMRIGWRMW